MGRRWLSPRSSGICLSISYTFKRERDDLPCLTLAIGVGLAELIEEIGSRGIGLKWPNDLIMRNAKLGGVLTELHTGAHGSVTVVVGLGINVDLNGARPEITPTSKFGPVIDLKSCCDDLPSRSALSALLIERLFNTIAEFDSDGFVRFHAAWPTYDWLRGQRICVEVANVTEPGVCEGIDSDGALLLRTPGGRKRIMSGSVQLNGQAVCRAS